LTLGRVLTRRAALAVSAGALAAMFALSAWAWGEVGDEPIPVHWGASGEVDGYGGRFEGLLLLPFVTAGVIALLAVVPYIEPRRAHLARSERAYATVWLALVAWMAALHVVIVASALGGEIEMPVFMGVGPGLLFLTIGAVLGRVESNFMFGVRTPWTLSSERSWRQTHRLAGRLFVAAGVATLLAGLATLAGAPAWVPVVALVVGATGAAIWSVAHSYVVWRADPERNRFGGG